MLFQQLDVKFLINKPIKGIIHIGTHECEERQFYIDHLYANDSNIVWIDALPEKVDKMRRMLPEAIILNECVSDSDT